MNDNASGTSGPARVCPPNGLCIELDARGFEPPQPLLKTLETVETLPAGATLRLHTRWRPALLYAELEKRGFSSQSEDQSDGSCLTYICRR